MRPRVLGVLAAIVLLVLGGCTVSVRSADPDRAPESAPDEGDLAPSPLPSISLEQSDDEAIHSELSRVIDDVLPAVVNVRVSSIGAGIGGPTESRGEGSGVVIDDKGIILTNNHVIANATEVKVVFRDGDSVIGQVVGTDPDRDLAVIRVNKDNLTAVELGVSADLRLGDDVVAIGFPLGLGGATVTKGIISAENRTIEVSDPSGEDSKLQGLLQTDAAINPGNSGGALIDAAGRLVGINTAAARAFAAENIGFAIAIDTAIPVVEDILASPQEERAYIGVFPVTLTPPIAAELGLDADQRGALIEEIIPDSPAEEAGLEADEVIVAIGDATIASAEDLLDTLRDHEPGDEVDVRLVSEDGERTVTLTLEQRPATFEDPED